MEVHDQTKGAASNKSNEWKKKTRCEAVKRVRLHRCFLWWKCANCNEFWTSVTQFVYCRSHHVVFTSFFGFCFSSLRRGQLSHQWLERKHRRNIFTLSFSLFFFVFVYFVLSVDFEKVKGNEKYLIVWTFTFLSSFRPLWTLCRQLISVDLHPFKLLIFFSNKKLRVFTFVERRRDLFGWKNIHFFVSVHISR